MTDILLKGVLTYPDWPVKVLLSLVSLPQLIDIRNPFGTVAADEH